MTISAKLVLDSISPDRIRLPSLQLRYPKFIHGEFLTHRVLSRSSSSSRAIPVERLIADVERDPVVPSFWGKNQRGMQAAEELIGDELLEAQYQWQKAKNLAVIVARDMAAIGAHKQIVNRILEPFSHIYTLVTSTEWVNFFGLRLHPAAQPEMRMLAEAIYEALATSPPPTELHHGEWHLPYVTEKEVAAIGGRRDPTGTLRKLSTARCARVSYLTHEMKAPSAADDLKLYDQLVGARPIHASPAEHQASPDFRLPAHGTSWSNPDKHGNFRGWVQHRKIVEELI